MKPVVIQGLQPGGQLTTPNDVDNPLQKWSVRTRDDGRF